LKDNKKQSITQVISAKVRDVANDFWKWLKPNPTDHWLIQILKSVAKVPLVILLVLCSPILFVVLLIVFLIAI
jgi:hypothetical protein